MHLNLLKQKKLKSHDLNTVVIYFSTVDHKSVCESSCPPVAQKIKYEKNNKINVKYFGQVMFSGEIYYTDP